MDVGGADVPGTGVGRRRRGASAAALALLTLLATALVVERDAAPVAAVGDTFVVDALGDEPDATPGDGVCSIGDAEDSCTLRAAIGEANRSPGHDRIEFALAGAGPHRFTPATRYPILVDPAGATIDGYTQPGSRPNTAVHGSNADIRIEIRGTGPHQDDIDGLYLTSRSNVVRGLALFDFKRAIYIRTADAVGNLVVGNFVGTDATGTFRQPDQVINSNGVHLERGASANVIGRPARADRNVIAGNGDKGVALYNDGTDRNVIQNNVVGLDPRGEPLGNRGHGIDLNHDVSDNVIGGLAAGQGNVVSGNRLSAVEISHDGDARSTTGNQVLGNLIGTGLDGRNGSAVFRNGEFGVNIEGRPSCPTVESCGPDVSDTIVVGNTIVGSAAGVMIWKGAHDNLVRDNRIGVLLDGTVAASALVMRWGVLIEAGAFDNRIERNVVAGTLNGIQIRSTNDYTNDDPTLQFDTFGNTLTRNSVWGIVNGLGIDISPISTPNDSPAATLPGVQGGIVVPTITSATEDRITFASSCAACRIELFSTDADISSDYGQGRVFLAEASTDAAGNAAVVYRSTAADPVVVPAGTRVSATVTDTAGNTSEYSRRVVVGAGPLGRPNPTTTTTTTTTTAPATTTTTTAPATSTTTTTTTTTTTVSPVDRDAVGRTAGGDLDRARRCGARC